MKIKWLDRRTVVAPYTTLCLSEKEFLAVCKHLKVVSNSRWVSEGARATLHTFDDDGSICCAACLSKEAQDTTGIEIASLLVHEATHIKQELMSSIGEKAPSPEFEAYTMQSICRELFDECARRLTKP